MLSIFLLHFPFTRNWTLEIICIFRMSFFFWLNIIATSRFYYYLTRGLLWHVLCGSDSRLCAARNVSIMIINAVSANEFNGSVNELQAAVNTSRNIIRNLKNANKPHKRSLYHVHSHVFVCISKSWAMGCCLTTSLHYSRSNSWSRWALVQ